MNATRWVSLTEFIKHLGRTGVVRVDETEKGLFIAWIDNSPKALAKAEANKKKERAVTSDEQRERMLVAEQIERANAATGDESRSSGSPGPAGLQREEGAASLRLTFGSKSAGSAVGEEDITPAPINPTSSNVVGTDSSTTTTRTTDSTPQPATKINVFKTSASSVPAKTAPLKTNVFKALKAKSSSSSSPSVSGSTASGDKRSREEMPTAQRLILEDQERKRRRTDAA